MADEVDFGDFEDDEDELDADLDSEETPKDKGKDKKKKVKVKEPKAANSAGVLARFDDRLLAIVLLIICGGALVVAIINLTGPRLPDSISKIQPADKWAVAFAPIVYAAPVLLVTVWFIRNSKDDRVKKLLVTAGVLAFCYAGLHTITTLVELMHPATIKISQGGFGGSQTTSFSRPVPTNAVFPFAGTRGVGLFLSNLIYIALFIVIGGWALRPDKAE